MFFDGNYITYEKLIEKLKELETYKDKIELLKKVKEYNNNLFLQENQLGIELKKIDKLIESNNSNIQEVSFEPKTKKTITKVETTLDENIKKSKDVKEIEPYYKELKKCQTENEIINILSKIDNKNIITKIFLNFREELVLLKNIKFDKTEHYTEEEILYLDEMIENIEDQFEIIKNYLTPNKEEIEECVEKPIIIYLKTNLDNICALSDAKDIPREYKENFNQLFKSILNGKFKNHKFLSNNSGFVSGLQEVKDFKIRIIYKNIGANIYVVMGMFMKKDTNDKGSSEFMKQRSTLFVKRERDIMNIVNNPDLLELESNITDKILDALGNMEKGENNNGRIIK